MLQGVSLLVDAACTPDSSAELCCAGFLQLQTEGLMTQLKARADKGMKTGSVSASLADRKQIHFYKLYLHKVSIYNLRLFFIRFKISGNVS